MADLEKRDDSVVHLEAERSQRVSKNSPEAEAERLNKIFDQELKERDKILADKYAGLPIWGGKMTHFDNAFYPAEPLAERLKWRDRLLDPKTFVSETDARVKIGVRLGELRNEAKERKRQIKSFLMVCESVNAADFGVKAILFDKGEFAKANFERRQEILLEITVLIDSQEEEIEGWSEKERERFFGQMSGMLASAKSADLVKAWGIYRKMEQRLKFAALFNDDQFEYFQNTVLDEKNACEADIESKLPQIDLRLARFDDPDDVTSVIDLRSDLDFLRKMPSQLKLSGRMGVRIVNLELAILEALNKDALASDPVAEKPREAILKSQNRNEFMRRMMAQIAALVMSVGRGTETAHMDQSSMVDGTDEAITKDTFAKKKTDVLVQAAAERTGVAARQLQVAEGAGGIDAKAALQNTKDSVDIAFSDGADGGLEVKPSEEAKDQNATAFWEISRVSSLDGRAASVEANEDWLRYMHDSGKHVTLTNQYMVISPEKTRSILKGFLVSGLQNMPGQTADAKRACLNTMFQMIDHAGSYGTEFVNEIFAYANTPFDDQQLAA